MYSEEMLRKRCLWIHVFLFFISFLGAQSYELSTYSFPPVVTGINPSFGSTEGGTIVTITGANFSPLGLWSEVVVYFGNDLCVFSRYFSTDSQIVCTAPKCRTSSCLSSENFQGSDYVTVSIYVSTAEGIVGDNSLTYYYYSYWTPLVIQMSHTAWGSSTGFIDARTYTTDISDVNIQVGGQQFSSFLLEPEASNLTTVTIGGNMGAYRAEIGQDILNVDFTDMYSYEKFIYYYPPDDMVGGFYNLTLSLQNDQSNGPRSTGLARMYPSHKLSDTYNYFYNFGATLKGTVYSLCLFPAISSVSPSSGSVAGGTAVNIQGYGFDSVLERYTVYVGGVPCDVISASDNVIQCVTRPATSNLLSLLTSTLKFRHPNQYMNTTRGYGSPGWWVKVWDYSDYLNNRAGKDAYLKFSFGWRQNMYLSLWYLYGSNWPSTLNYNSRSGYSTNYAADIASKFTAPYTGYYTFHLCIDDEGVLYMSKIGVGIAEIQLAYITSWCTNGDYWMYKGQISQGIPLNRGEQIYLRIRTVRILHKLSIEMICNAYFSRRQIHMEAQTKRI